MKHRLGLALLLIASAAFCRAAVAQNGCRDPKTGCCYPAASCPTGVARCWVDPTNPCAFPTPTPTPTPTATPTPTPGPNPTPTPGICLPPIVDYPVQYIDCHDIAFGPRGETLCAGRWIVLRDSGGKLFPLFATFPKTQ